MRATTLLIAMLGLVVLSTTARAQCIYPPRAPDTYNTPGFYYWTCYGMTYGPNYYVYPPFSPFQGMLLADWPLAAKNTCQNGGLVGFPSHLYARSPRDFFMIDTDPRSSPYRYGAVGAGRAPLGD